MAAIRDKGASKRVKAPSGTKSAWGRQQSNVGRYGVQNRRRGQVDAIQRRQADATRSFNQNATLEAWLREKALKKEANNIAKWNAAAAANAAAGVPTAPTDPGSGPYSGGGPGGGFAAQVNSDYNNQLGQVNAITMEQAAKLKQLQDQYAAAAAAAGQGIANDTSQLQGQFGQQLAGINTDLAAQGVAPGASPVGAEGQIQSQALADAQLRGQTFLKQLQLAQGANFADRQMQNELTAGGFRMDLAQQQAAALAGAAGGGGGGGGGRGGGGGGGGGSSYYDRLNAQGMLNFGQDLGGETSGYRDWLRQQGHGAFKGMPLQQAALKDLRRGIAPDSLMGRFSAKKNPRVVNFLKRASKAYTSKKKVSPARAFDLANRALDAGRGR